MKLFLLFACIFVTLLSFTQADTESDFNAFRLKYGKVYESVAVLIRRLTNYLINRRTIEQQNELFRQGKSLFEVSSNKFSDMTYEEKVARATGYIPPARDTNGIVGATAEVKSVKDVKISSVQVIWRTIITAIANLITKLLTLQKTPEVFDWRTKGAVSPVKDQKWCSSCWAFTAIAALESHNFIKTQKMVILSEQNLIDCTNGNTKNNSMYESWGCNGGIVSRAFNFIRDQPGVNTESSYPYTALNTTCKYNPATVGATDKGFASIAMNETNIKDVVASTGPVAVSFHASNLFMQYKSGIYNEANCPTVTNHAILIVGYGTANGTDYWIIKNSWGADWGEQGFARVIRGVNQCGINTRATFPLL